MISFTILLFLSGFSLGIAFGKTTLENKTQIAKPILEVENGDPININANQTKGTYEFKVRNYEKEGNVTQVDMEYYIEMIIPTEKTISFKIFKNGEELKVSENKTDRFLLTKKEAKEDQYKIEIQYDKNSQVKIEEAWQEIHIKVHSEQKKA